MRAQAPRSARTEPTAAEGVAYGTACASGAFVGAAEELLVIHERTVTITANVGERRALVAPVVEPLRVLGGGRDVAEAEADPVAIAVTIRDLDPHRRAGLSHTVDGQVLMDVEARLGRHLSPRGVGRG